MKRIKGTKTLILCSDSILILKTRNGTWKIQDLPNDRNVTLTKIKS